MARTTKNKTAHAAGLDAEWIAAWILRFKGYRILATRYRTPVGEIDIIARRRRTIVFVEVKRRAALDDALGSVLPQARARITRAAAHFMAGAPRYQDCGLRFDVIALAPPRHWRHVCNAWES